MQWEKYSEGFDAAKAGAIEHGIPVATRPAVGYRQREAAPADGRKDRRLEHDPVAAPVVRQVFERRAGGAGPVELGELLEAEVCRRRLVTSVSTRPAPGNVEQHEMGRQKPSAEHGAPSGRP